MSTAPTGAMTFGERLKAIRARRGVTQRWVAREAKLSASFLCDVERDKREPSAETLARLADVLGFTMDELWRGGGRVEEYAG